MTRGKRLLSLLLSVLMLCTLLPPRASAAPTLYFTAVNDRMCDLNDETMPFWQNGLLYVAGATGRTTSASATRTTRKSPSPSFTRGSACSTAT